MNEKQTKQLLEENNVEWEEFQSFMVGQTCPILENGEVGYYKWDVERFIRHKKNGSPLMFD